MTRSQRSVPVLQRVLLGVLGLAAVASRSSTAAAEFCGPRTARWLAEDVPDLPGPVPRAFKIKAFNGTIQKNGGKCLDYAQEIAGAPIVLNDCSAAHAFFVQEIAKHDRPLRDHLGNEVPVPRQHEVIIGTGSKVIGMRSPKIINTSDLFGIAGPLITSDPILELEDYQGSSKLGQPTAYPYQQAFALDGDSILLAANRNLAARVPNGRGLNGSPITMAARELADAELWQFSATDGADVDPTSAFHRVFDALQLQTALQSADFDTVIEVRADIDLTPLQASLVLRDGVTIRGDRRGTSFGSELRVDTECVDGVLRQGRVTADSAPCGNTIFASDSIDASANDTRITGLRIRGPSRANDVQPVLHGLSLSDNFRTFVDRNDLSDWTNSAIHVVGPSPNESDTCPPAEASQQNPRTNMRILRNFIHHNEAWKIYSPFDNTGGGYAVVVDTAANPTIAGNTFLMNRHAIADGGDTMSGYAAHDNIVLTEVPTWWPYYGPQQDFDVHGRGQGATPGKWTGGFAGSEIDIAWNTFFGGNRDNFELRGTPCTDGIGPDLFRSNVTETDHDSSVKIKNGFWSYLVDDEGSIELIPDEFGNAGTTAELRLRMIDNQYGETYARPRTQDLRVGDFDGDGVDDLFMATGAAFYYSPGGHAEWRLLGIGRTDRAMDLLFGDFDGDGRTDVVGKNNGLLYVSWGGASDWEFLNSPADSGIDPAIADMAVGNFDGTGPDDLFFADGQSWFVSSSGKSPFVPVGTSSFRVKDVRFGDFNGNGTTDVFGVVDNKWMFSDGATVGWETVRDPAATKTVDDLFVADFNGEGYADVAMQVEGSPGWKISYRGFEPWQYVLQNHALTKENVAGIGHFTGHAASDVLMFNENETCDASMNSHHLCISHAAITTLERYSPQDMR